MSASPPLLTLVIPTRNRCSLAEEALRSALLPLSFPHEVLLSDNASSDLTPDLRSLFPTVRYIRRGETIPMAEHWNLCVNEARGKYVKVLCDDDWLIPGALEREVAALESDPALVLCASARLEVRAGEAPRKRAYTDSPLRLEPQQSFWRMLKDENFVGPPSCVTFRKDRFLGFPTQYSYAADWAAWLLLASKGAVLILGDAGANFRLHETNLTQIAVEEGTDFIEVQALRSEATRRLTGSERWLGTLLLTMIYGYRFARRTGRYLGRGNFSGYLRFLAKVTANGPALLPRT